MSVRDVIQAAAGVGGAEVETDPYFANTTLLLQGDVSNPDLTYNAFSDASGNEVNITPNGDARGSSFSPYNTSWGVDFPKSGYVRVPSSAVSGTTTGDITIQVWVNPREFSISSLFQRIFSFGSGLSNDVTLNIDTSGNLVHRFNDAVRITSSSPLIANTWQLVTFSRSSGVVRLFIGSTQVASYTGSDNYSSASSNDLWIGAEAGSTGTGTVGDFNGLMADFRVRKGVGVTSVTVPTSQFTAESGTSVIACSSNRFIDKTGTTAAFTIYGTPKITGASPFLDTDTTTGSGYFDGSGDYLQLADNDAWHIGGGDFTLDGWIYKLDKGNWSSLIGQRVDASNEWRVILDIDNGNTYTPGNFRFDWGGGVLMWTSANIPNNAWTHFALVRSGTTGTLYINGVSVGTNTMNNVSNYAAPLRIASNDGTGEYYLGYISNLRLVKGSAIAPSSVPTSPSTAVSGTELLTCQTRGAVRNIGFRDESEYNHVITKVGNCAQGTFSPFSQEEGKWSNYFDGSGDYLGNTSTALIAQSVSTFTIEGWIYMTANPTTDANNISGFITVDGQPAGSTNFMSFGPTSSRVLYLRWFDGSGKTAIGSTTLNLNQWYHIACVVNSNAIQFYVNGVAESMSGTTTLTNRSGTVSNFSIGRHYYGAFTGYISNIRVTTTAVYTSGFTPSGPLTNITNTRILTCQSNRFIDNSSNAFALTPAGDVAVQPFSPFAPSAAYDPDVDGGSVNLDGSGDWVVVNTPGDIIYPGAYTVEGWFYKRSASNVQQVLAASGFLTGANYLRVETNGGAGYFYTTNNSLSAPPGSINLNEWTHFAFTRDSSNNIAFFLNGVRRASDSNISGNIYLVPNGQTFVLGQWLYDPTRDFDGYISSVRAIGSSIYDPTLPTLTVPTAPPTPTTNTSLLLNFTNAGVIDATGRNVIETVGNAHVETSVKKYGTGSLEFDGDADYLVIPGTLNSTFGSGSFTIEGWFRVPSVPGGSAYYSLFHTGFPLQIYVTGGTVKVWAASAGSGSYDLLSALSGPTNAVQANTWHYFAVVRDGSTFRVYVDGVSGSPSGTVTGAIHPTNFSAFGTYPQSLGSYPYIGLVDEIRVTKGIARYTGSSHTVPDKSLPNQ